MEYVDGPDLATLRKAYAEVGDRVPVAAALHVALELCKGLDFAHRRGVIHRDISPSNVLLSMAGEVKIADFGIAKAVDSRSSLTMSRRIMGKWRYMSPEQTRGDPLDARSDIFSAGVVLQELLTGVPLFHGRNIDDIVQNICAMPVPQASVLRPELPAGLDAVLARALERNVEDRYANASDLVRDLTEVCFASKLVPTPNSLAEAIGQSFRDLAPTDTGEPRPAGPAAADDFIEAELARGQDGPESTRVTVQLGRQAGVPGQGRKGGPAVEAADFLGREATHTTFVRGNAGSDGLPVWERPTEISPPAPEPAIDPALAARAPARRGRWGAIAVLCALAVVGAVGLWALWPDEQEEAAVRPGQEPREPRSRPRLTVKNAPGTAFSPDLSRTAATERTAQQPHPDVAPVAVDAGSAPPDAAPPAALSDAGTPAAVDKRRKRVVRRGKIHIHSEPWAYIYLRGRKLGETPARGLELPVGRHRLELVNPVQQRRTTLWVDVPRDEPYQVELP
jgi:serine/threonine-protein kinase